MELLYYPDSYLKEFEANIISCSQAGVVLERTAFYPTGGGQPHDTGSFSVQGIPYQVKEVRKDSGSVLHVLEKPLQLSGTVQGTIDWNRRYLLMRYHTAAHLLSSVIHNATGAKITGNQLDSKASRIDYSLEEFDRGLFQECIVRANQLIDQAIPVTIRMLSLTQAAQIPSLVKLQVGLPPGLKEIRVVEIKDIDLQACGGTHVRNISEIGRIELQSIENKGKNNRRVYFKLA